MTTTKATESNPEKMNDRQLSAYLKYQYQVVGHAADRLDYALRLLLRGERPDTSLKTLRKNHVNELDKLQIALDIQMSRQTTMR